MNFKNDKMEKPDLKELYDMMDKELRWRLNHVFDEVWNSESLKDSLLEKGYSQRDLWDSWNTPLVKQVDDFLTRELE